MISLNEPLRDTLPSPSSPVAISAASSSSTSSTDTSSSIVMPTSDKLGKSDQSKQLPIGQLSFEERPESKYDVLPLSMNRPLKSPAAVNNNNITSVLAQPSQTRSMQPQSHLLRRTQSRYFETFGNATNSTGNAENENHNAGFTNDMFDVSVLSNNLSTLNLSSQHTQADAREENFLSADARFEHPGYESTTGAQRQVTYGFQSSHLQPNQLSHLSNDYLWRYMPSGRMSAWSDSSSMFVPSDAYSQPRVPSANSSGAYNTMGSNKAYSPSKSDTKIPESNFSSSPQYRQPAFTNHISQTQEHTEDELIPTAIVIKNIPFAVKKEQLMDTMLQLGLTLPYAFNYHFDNGIFRGLAFANFATPEDTAQVIQSLNGHEIAGRKLRVEYKKMLPAADRERIEREKRGKRGQLEEQHRPSFSSLPKAPISAMGIPSNIITSSPTRPIDLDLNDPDTLNIYSEILLFRDDMSREELVFSGGLTTIQKRNISLLAHSMGLLHTIHEDGDSSEVIVTRVASMYRQVPETASALIDGYTGPGYGYADRSLRGTKSFADIRSTTRINTMYPAPPVTLLSGNNTNFGHVLRAPQA
ncbi:hypothetical protein V1511DRAFT_510307 [Dipodascopsis uninucleata]